MIRGAFGLCSLLFLCVVDDFQHPNRIQLTRGGVGVVLVVVVVSGKIDRELQVTGGEAACVVLTIVRTFAGTSLATTQGGAACCCPCCCCCFWQDRLRAAGHRGVGNEVVLTLVANRRDKFAGVQLAMSSLFVVFAGSQKIPTTAIGAGGRTSQRCPFKAFK